MVTKIAYSHRLFAWVLFAIGLVYHHTSLACTDIRGELSEFNCLDYDPDSSTFRMTCSFAWGTEDTTKCIVLHKNEVFEGNGHSINLTEVSNYWEGLFQIATNENGPSSLADAPVIHDVHMIGGETSGKGGFIIQAEQKHFIVKHCSSSGVIQGQDSSPHYGGGGICGQKCSGDILITRCWSTGEMRARAGGIAGRELGVDSSMHNTVTISHCYSTGGILGNLCGGICGFQAGYNSRGMVIIKQCYSLGEIGGLRSGGITGADPGRENGHVSIINCYSRGDITGSTNAGGICGRKTGLAGGTVILTNVYASGKIDRNDAGGLIGNIAASANEINITMSVYNGDTGDMIGGTRDAHNKEKNSGDLGDITGTVYCYTDDDSDGKDRTPTQNQYCWNNETIWKAVKDDFPILVDGAAAAAEVTPTGIPSPYPTTSPSATPSNWRQRYEMELPVQYPPRSVIMEREDRKHKKKTA